MADGGSFYEEYLPTPSEEVGLYEEPKSPPIVFKGAFPAVDDKKVNIRTYDPGRGFAALNQYGYNDETPLYKEYYGIVNKLREGKNVPAKARAEFIVGFILQTFKVLKLENVDVFYVGEESSPLFRCQRGTEALNSFVSLWWQIFFGRTVDTKTATEGLVSSILPGDYYKAISRDFVYVAGDLFWSKKDADLITLADLPPTTRVFAKMFDTDPEDEDENVFVVPPFDEEAIDLMEETYNSLKDVSFYDWPEQYHLQCFKDWSVDRLPVEFGIFTVVAGALMKNKPRGSLFNVGIGKNGKSVCDGLAVSLIGANNVSQVKGRDIGKWDYLVDLQTTWLNIPDETDIDFLKEQTEDFKILSAHGTARIRKKHGDGGVKVPGDFLMVFNLNKIPDLGDDASAVLSRMFINNFDNEFQVDSATGENFSRKTFLSDKETMPILTGMALAFCHYYANPEHPWKPSKTMTEERDAMAETATPQFRYMKWFKMFFIGYSGISVLKPDYAAFGRSEGEEYDLSVIKAKSLQFKEFKRGNDGDGAKYTLKHTSGYPVKRFLFRDDIYIAKYMGNMDIEQYHHNGHSLVYDMMQDYLSKETEFRKMLADRDQNRTEEEIQKAVLQEIFNEIEAMQGRSPYERKPSGQSY